MVKADILNIGDELLIGQVINSNAAYIGAELSKIGIAVHRIIGISDDEVEIISVLDESLKNVQVVIITGGLGPTNDDLTKQALSKYFKSQLVFNEKVYEDIKRLFMDRGREVKPVNKMQAEIPAAAKPVFNKLGTAPGMWFEKENKIIVSLPGVPYEMKAMMAEQVIPSLVSSLKRPAIIHKTIHTIGVSESLLAEKIKPWEDQLPDNMKLAYLPSLGCVRLRISAAGNDEVKHGVEEQINHLKILINDYIFGYDDDSLEKIIGEKLSALNQTVATAESCTGGYIAHLITSVPGSSRYYMGSVVAYDNEVKKNVLKVNEEDIKTFGAVSEQVAYQMAMNVKKILKADFSISVTGIAGPGGAAIEKPVGTVWIGVSTPVRTFTKHFLFTHNRERNIRLSGIFGLNMLRMAMEGKI
jgi:nicotinamide-nucleotide amidase